MSKNPEIAGHIGCKIQRLWTVDRNFVATKGEDGHVRAQLKQAPLMLHVCAYPSELQGDASTSQGLLNKERRSTGALWQLLLLLQGMFVSFDFLNLGGGREFAFLDLVHASLTLLLQQMTCNVPCSVAAL